MNCSESSDEEASVSKENFLQLSCFISPEVRYMLSGLKSKMKENLTKHSEFLGRDAKFSRSVSEYTITICTVLLPSGIPLIPKFIVYSY